MPSLTAAERQRRYRAKAKGEALLTRLQVMIAPHPAACLDRLARTTGKTRRELVEQAILELADRVGVRFE